MTLNVSLCIGIIDNASEPIVTVGTALNFFGSISQQLMVTGASVSYTQPLPEE